MNTGKRQRRPTARYIAYYGLRMLTASRERSIRHAVNRDNDNSVVMMWNDDSSGGETAEGGTVVEDTGLGDTANNAP